MTRGAPPASLRAFVCGVTGSGKTSLLRRLFIERSPRSLILAQTAEWGEPDALTLPELLRVLHKRAAVTAWRVVASLELEEVAELAELLLPRPGRSSYALEVGGLALVLDEVDMIAGRSAPPGGTPALWRRGRHAGLSVYAATQRPADVQRAVTAMSEWLCICRVHEPGDLGYLAKVLAPDALEALATLPEYGAVLWQTATRSGYVVDRNLSPVALVGAGAPKPPGDPAAAARARARAG